MVIRMMGFENNAGKFFWCALPVVHSHALACSFASFCSVWNPFYHHTREFPRPAAPHRRFLFIIYLTLNLMAFYGIMGVYVTPSLVVASVLSGFFYGQSQLHRSETTHEAVAIL